jgi:type IV secretory pathway ATPase VirB11/archaellum biosynthesis ATPase
VGGSIESLLLVSELTLSDLVRNRTISEEIAVTLGEAAARRASFLVVAIPRFAGKSTLMRAMLAHAPPGKPVRVVGEDGLGVERLARVARVGYLVVPEVSRFAAAPGYVWGAPVRAAFRAMADGTALATALHADGAAQALEVLVRLNRVPPEDVARLDLVIYLRSLGSDMARPTRRVVATVDEVLLRDGTLALRPVHRWNELVDAFEVVAG